ncbi:camp-dependent protein kinase 2 [Chlamydoabsidia padenii]|nr:camp-dependent protein kinase 2 [Chlamydoabsidia padenii]
MALLNNLMDKTPTNSNETNKKEPIPLSSSSSPFPSVSSLLHHTPTNGLQPSTSTNILPPSNSTPMNVDSPGNKRGWQEQEQEQGNKHPRRSADTITNDFTHQVSVSGQVTPSQSTHANHRPMDYNKQVNNSYTSIYNDQVIIQHRQNRPQLKLSDFYIMRTLGTGSFGRVHLIKSRVNARHYAMKVLKKSEVVRLKQVEHTNNEKHILEGVGHPYLINCWGTFQDDSHLFIVSDFVAGGELFSVLRRSHRFPDHVAKFYAGEVLLALEYLHSKDIVYRDLKPENLLLDNQGHIKIIDFGFAKYVPDITWTLCGTPDYLAPEVIQSKGYGKAVDWWSLGVLIYEMLAGQPPFYDDDHLKLYEKILAGKIRWPTYFDPAAISLLRKLLTSDLSKRYGNLKGGSGDIKRHAWFDGLDFNLLLAKQIKAPYIPTIRGDGDASHFDKYPETNEQYGSTGLNDPYRDLFLSF